MIASMTGFARRETTGAWGTLVCELRSVNHRFLEAGFRLPDELRAAEGELRARLAKQLRRGKVDCTVSFRRAQGASNTLEVDPVALERVLAAVQEVERSRLASGAVNALDVLRWPGVLREDGNSGGEELQAAAYAVFGATLDELIAARAREGARLRELLEQRCEGLEALVTAVRARLPEVQARVRARLTERVAELAASVDPERMEQELAIILQRLDVDEELERLTGHIAEVRRVIGGSEPAGRRLDFLMQELNREANTLSSKSQDLETTRAAVDMKVIIEQMREQVQNAE
ncbi:MAG TPA: YicC/YloC family endoribonuclease [Steroidobacteraceae bacterium]